MARALFTELVGTWLFISSIGLAIHQAGDFAPLAIGLALTVLVFMGGHISGAHYNPAVSLGVLVTGQIGFGKFIGYVLMQCLGAFAGAATSSFITGTSFAVAPDSAYPLMAVLSVEGLFTFMLMLVILNVAVTTRTTPNSYYGLAIGLTIVVAAYVGGGISGGAFNPAVATGSILWDSLMANGSSLANLWMYWVAPPVGALLAALFFQWQDSEVVPNPAPLD